MPEAAAKSTSAKQAQSKLRGPVNAPARTGAGSRYGAVMDLHRSAGNRAVASLMQPHIDHTTLPPAVADVIQTPGQPLDPDAREFMETRFGQDFGGVRVHDDGSAGKSADAINSNAYTVGNHIVFGPNRFSAESESGRLLLAHELAHVVQQSRGGWSPLLSASSPLEESSRSAAQQILHGPSTPVTVSGASAVGISREAKSLTSTLNPQTLNDQELQQETLLVNQWLSQHAAVSDPQSEHMMQSLKLLEGEYHRRHSAPPAPKRPLLPKIGGEGKEQLIAVMSAISSIRPSEIASGIFTIEIEGETKNLTPAQVDQIKRQASGVLKDHLRQVENKAETAKGGYDSQTAVDKKHWIVAPIVKTLGRIQDPGPYLLADVNKAHADAQAAYKAIESGDYARAARLLATSEAAATSASKMWQAYFEGIINAGEMTVTALEITRDAAFITLGILATIATGGAAAGALGFAEGGAATTTVLGFEVGTATAANAIAVGAPIVANVSEAVAKVAMGDKVDWGMLVVDTAVQIVIAKFGGRVTQGIGKAILGNPATESLAGKVTEKVVHAAVMHAGSTALMTAAQDTYKALKGQDVTWQSFIDELIARLTDPKSLAVVAVTGALTSAAEAKFGSPKPTPSSESKSSGTKGSGTSSDATTKPPAAKAKTEQTGSEALQAKAGSAASADVTPTGGNKIPDSVHNAPGDASLPDPRATTRATASDIAKTGATTGASTSDIAPQAPPQKKPDATVTPITAAKKGLAQSPQLEPGQREVTSLEDVRARKQGSTEASGSQPKKINKDAASQQSEESQSQARTEGAAARGSTSEQNKSSTPTWDDPAITEDEHLEQYKKAVKSPMSDNDARQQFRKGLRFDPESSRWKRPVAPKPDVRSQFKFYTDEKAGKIYKVGEGELGTPGSVQTHRKPGEQTKVSGGTGDDAGHLIGNRFGAPGGEENLAPQNWKANRYGTFKKLENEWASKLKAGFQIKVKVTDITVSGEDRPFARKVTWTETAPDGSVVERELDFANMQTPESRAKRGIKPTVSGDQTNNVIGVDFQKGERLPTP